MTFTNYIYFYTIKLKNFPIYIGSTTNIEKREIDHNKELNKAISNNGHSQYLYEYLRHKTNKIKLEFISKCYDDIVIIGENIFEHRRNIEEEKLILHCLNKGCCLLNMTLPSRFWKENNNLIDRNPEKRKINLTNYKVDTNNEIYTDIYNYITKIDTLQKIINKTLPEEIDTLLFSPSTQEMKILNSIP